MKKQLLTIRQAIDVASKYTYKNRLSDMIGYGSPDYWKKNLGSYDTGRKKDFIVRKKKIDGQNHMIITNAKTGKDILFYRTNYKYKSNFNRR